MYIQKSDCYIIEVDTLYYEYKYIYITDIFLYWSTCNDEVSKVI